MQMPIYMDNNATTPIDPAVSKAMRPFYQEQFGNPSSAGHSYGWQAKMAVDEARKKVAALFNCQPKEVIWTSGATESNNLAILGVAYALKDEKPHFITQATEHKAVLEVFDRAKEFGTEVTVLPVNKEGLLELPVLEKAIKPNTRLISVMAANNEVGTLQPICDIADLCKKKKIIFHTDAAQAAGKIPCDLAKIPIDLISVSSHKMYGPKGMGALIYRPVNREFALRPLFAGGDQELGLRPGTLNVPGIVGLGVACEIFQKQFADECKKLCGLRDSIINGVKAKFPDVHLNGPEGAKRLCNNVSFSVPGLCVDDLALGLSGIAYSSGSACNSANPKPSHVLKAMGLSDELAKCTIRLGIGRFTSETEVSQVLSKLLKLLEKSTPSKNRAAVV